MAEQMNPQKQMDNEMHRLRRGEGQESSVDLLSLIFCQYFLNKNVPRLDCESSLQIYNRKR